MSWKLTRKSMTKPCTLAFGGSSQTVYCQLDISHTKKIPATCQISKVQLSVIDLVFTDYRKFEVWKCAVTV